MIGLDTTTKIFAKKVITLNPHLPDKQLVEIQGVMRFKERERLGFKIWFCLLLNVSAWTNYLAYSTLSFLLCKMGTLNLQFSGLV